MVNSETVQYKLKNVHFSYGLWTLLIIGLPYKPLTIFILTSVSFLINFI